MDLSREPTCCGVAALAISSADPEVAGTAFGPHGEAVGCGAPEAPDAPAIALARSRIRLKAGLWFRGHQTALKGRTSPAMGRYETPGNTAAVIASLTTVRPR